MSEIVAFLCVKDIKFVKIYLVKLLNNCVINLWKHLSNPLFKVLNLNSLSKKLLPQKPLKIPENIEDQNLQDHNWNLKSDWILIFILFINLSLYTYSCCPSI